MFYVFSPREVSEVPHAVPVSLATSIEMKVVHKTVECNFTEGDSVAH